MSAGSITLERYECTGCGKSIRADDYCRCRVGQEKEIADARADHARADKIKAAERAAERADLDRLIAEAATWAVSPEGIAEEAAQDAEQERQAKAAEAFKATIAPPLPARDDGLAVLRRQAAKEQADAAQDAELADRERAVKGRELSRRERRQDDGDAAQETADTPAEGLTLADFTVAFAEGVDLAPLPAVVQRQDGATVLYAGKLNWIFGLPGSGKSWVSIIAIQEAVLRGGNVLLLDFEDTPATFQRRAALLGFNPALYADSFRYIRPGLTDTPTAIAEAQQWLASATDASMSLAVVDAAESSGCPSDGSDVNPWLARMVKPWRDVGAGVLCVDHIPKRSEDRPNGPIGSQRKLAAVDGAALAISGLPWTKARGGTIVLSNHKDRGGDLPAAVGQPVAVIVGNYQDGPDGIQTFGYTIQAPEKQADIASLSDQILALIGAAGAAGIMGLKRLRGVVKGNNGAIDTAIEELVNGGHITCAKAGSANWYTIGQAGMERLNEGKE